VIENFYGDSHSKEAEEWISRKDIKFDMVFVRNGFCLHMAYNTINTEHLNNQKQIENYYTNNLLNKI